MRNSLPFALVVSLALTVAIEAVFFFVAGKRNKKDLLLTVFSNVITNPVVVLLYWLAFLYTSLNLVLVKSVLELFAVITEGFYYNKYGQQFKHPYLFSAAANMFSFGIGVLLQLIIGEV